MSANFENTTPLKVAEQAERDLNTDAAKKGHAGSDSSTSPLLLGDVMLQAFILLAINYEQIK